MQLELIEGSHNPNIKMNNVEEDNSPRVDSSVFNYEVFDQIQRFLRDNRRNSEHTASNYERDIRNFFNKTRRGKDIEFLTKDDLVYSIEDIEDYYAYLIDVQGVSINTANRYFSSVRECFRHLNRRSMIDNISFLEIKTFTDVTNHYGILTMDEIAEALELVLMQGKKEVGLIKHLMIKFAVDTSARLNDCLTIKWNNFTIENDTVKINMIGKGNKEFKPTISKSLYNKILQLKRPDSDLVFNIHRNTVQRMMNQLREDMDISKDRNITFHSFKKTGVDFIWKQTRDINQARKAANHSNNSTTEIYIDRDEDYGVMGFFSSSDGVDEELYKKVDCKTLRTAIEELDKGQQMHLNLKINELLEKVSLQT